MELQNLLKATLFLMLFAISTCFSQVEIVLDASLNEESKTISINQKLTYTNTSKDTLRIIYFNDWANSYASKNAELAKRFTEEFKKSIHLAKDADRGFTTIYKILNNDNTQLNWERTSYEDILKVVLATPLPPNQKTVLNLEYAVQLPPNKFTSYGYGTDGSYYLKNWYLTPAVYNTHWHLYANKNLEDLYTPVANTKVNFTHPKKLKLTSNYIIGSTENSENTITHLSSKLQKSAILILAPENVLTKHVLLSGVIETDLAAPRYSPIEQSISIQKVTEFIIENLGDLPQEKLVVRELDYNRNPLYGINQLPSFVRPYGEAFQFELKFLKTAVATLLDETLFLNPRKDYWLPSAITNYMMMKYVAKFYPNQKLLGKLSRIWGFRKYQLAKMDFNDQYSFLYNLTARKNLDQSLQTSKDSLIKFNQKIANRYKAGLGLTYLADYIGPENVANSLKSYYAQFQLKESESIDFKSILESNTTKNIDWFFNEYVASDKRIDFKIVKAKKQGDSINLQIKNKNGAVVPISLSGIKNDTVITNYWFSNITDVSDFTIPNNLEERLVLNYEQTIPEFNQRDNWKSLGGFLSSNRKVKFTFFKDAEDPNYNQVFYVPIVNFNVYDGWVPGIRLYNKTLLERPFVYDFAPSYSFREKTIVGYGKFNFRKYLNKSGLYVSNYRLSASTSHFDVNSRYTSITPSVSFGWRPDDLRDNQRQALSFRYINILRDFNADAASRSVAEETPDYSVLNARFVHRDNDIIDYKSWFIDFQLARNFSKIAFEYEYRKLFENNRQLNLRFFAGKFISNNTNKDSNFFSFALDRPTDYLFDYGYLGRSEDSGIYSQQIIIAEGGFKSFLDERYRFSDNWMATVNTSFNLWKWIELYGDAGLVKNKDFNEKFVYNSGVRLNLVTDYFELYFPVHSNNGWEISQPNYGEKIRFIITVSPKTLTGLFTRKWF